MNRSIVYNFCLLLFLVPFLSNAQDILLEETIDYDSLDLEYGENGKRFTHTFAKFGFVVGPSSAGSEIKYGNSSEFEFGVLHKRKVAGFYDIGYMLMWNTTAYRLEQNDTKVLPDTIQHFKERINVSSLQLALYNRINFGKRGNMIRTFLDIGAYGAWNYVASHNYVDKRVVPNTGQTEVRNRRLSYINDFEYGVMAKLGYHKWSVYGKYRLSEMVLSSYGYNDFPLMIVGLEMDIY